MLLFGIVVEQWHLSAFDIEFLIAGTVEAEGPQLDRIGDVPPLKFDVADLFDVGIVDVQESLRVTVIERTDATSHTLHQIPYSNQCWIEEILNLLYR